MDLAACQPPAPLGIHSRYDGIVQEGKVFSRAGEKYR
jgi:hypothetical protein